MLRWENKVVALHLVLWPLLAGAVLKAGSWVDESFYQDGEIKRTAIVNYRAAVGAGMARVEKAEPKRHRRRHR